MRGPNILRWIVASFDKKILYGDIITHFLDSNDQLANIFTKPSYGPRIDYIWLGTLLQPLIFKQSMEKLTAENNIRRAARGH